MNFMAHYCTVTCFDRCFESLQIGCYKKQRNNLSSDFGNGYASVI